MNVDDIIAFEEGGMDELQEIKLMQSAVNSGMAWRLQGSYGREAMRLIEDGSVMLGEKGNYDFYGNYVPSRYEVKPGTKGSPEYHQRWLDLNT